MNATLITIAVFAIVLAPFAMFMLLLYARSRRPAVEPGPPKPSSLDALPIASQRWIAAAGLAILMGLGSHGQRLYANVWIDRIIWFLVPLFLGAAFGHWQADRMAKADRSSPGQPL
jgi:hypothetical protein